MIVTSVSTCAVKRQQIKVNGGQMSSLESPRLHIEQGIHTVKQYKRGLSMCIICRFIVMKNNTPKYINNIGQNTGTSNTEKNVMTNAVQTPRAHAIQNLNSGNRRANGRYSFPSLAVLGSDNPSSRCPPTSVGSSNGLKKAIKLFNRNIPRPYATMK